MIFKKWLENEFSGVSFPNRGSDTPASDEVKRTGLQPQVDAQEIETKQKKSQDKILAIDSQMKHFEVDIPSGDEESDPKVAKFKSLWDKFKKKWDEIKMKDDNKEDESGQDGLGGTLGNSNFVNSMQQNPNLTPNNVSQLGVGPGNFGG